MCRLELVSTMLFKHRFFPVSKKMRPFPWWAFHLHASSSNAFSQILFLVYIFYYVFHPPQISIDAFHLAVPIHDFPAYAFPLCAFPIIFFASTQHLQSMPFYERTFHHIFFSMNSSPFERPHISVNHKPSYLMTFHHLPFRLESSALTFPLYEQHAFSIFWLTIMYLSIERLSA